MAPSGDCGAVPRLFAHLVISRLVRNLPRRGHLNEKRRNMRSLVIVQKPFTNMGEG